MSFNAINAGTIAAIITMDSSKFTAGVNTALSTLTTLGDSGVSTQKKMLALGRGMENVGIGMTKFVSVPVATMLLGCAAATIKFESAMTGVAKTANLTDTELANLGEGILDMSKEIPMATTELAAIAEVAGQLGIQTQNLESFTRVMAMMSTSTNMNAEEAATQMARFANITSMAQSDFDRLGSVIVELGNNFATTESEISEAAQRLAGAGTLVGMSEDEILAIAAAYTSLGINVEAGGTAISRVLRTIETEVATGGESLRTFAEVAGYAGPDAAAKFAAAWEGDPAKVFDEVVKGLNKIHTSGGNVIKTLQDMGFKEIRVTDALSRLATSGTVLTSALQHADQAWKDNTALATEAERRYATTESQIKLLGNQVNVVAIQFGQMMLPAIEAVVGGIRDFLNWIENLDSGTKSVILTIAKFAVIGGPIIAIFGKIITAVTQLTMAHGLLQGAFTTTAIATRLSNANLAGYAKTLVGLPALVTAWAVSKMGSAAATGAETAAETTALAVKGSSALATTAMTGATVAYTGAQTAATAATMSFYGVLAKHPVGAIVLAVAALVGVVIALAKAFSSSEEDIGEYTATTRANKEAMEEAQAEYDKVIEKHDEGSDAALKAKAALDEATKAYEDNKITIEEWTKEVDEAVEASGEVRDSAMETVGVAEVEAGRILNLVDSFNRLNGASRDSAEEQQEMAAVVTELNEKVPGLSLAYDANTDSVEGNTDAVKNLANAEATRLQNQAALDSYNELQDQYADILLKVSQAEEEEKNALTELNAAKIDGEGVNTRMAIQYGRMTGELGDAQDAYDAAKDSTEKLKQEQAALEKEMADLLPKVQAAQEYNNNYSRAMSAVQSGTMTAKEAAEEYGIAVEMLNAGVTTATEEGLTDMIDALNTIVATTPGLASALSDAGWSVDAMAQKLSEMGLDADTVADQFDSLVTAAQNGTSRIEASQLELTGSNTTAMQQLNANYDYNQECTRIWGESIKTIMEKTGRDSSDAWIQSLINMGPEGYAILQELAQGTKAELNYTAANFDESGQTATNAFVEALGILPDEAMLVVDTMGEDLNKKMSEIGKNLPQGLAQGIGEGGENSTAAAEAMAVDAVTASADALGVQSPSVKYHQMGVYCAAGLANGFREGSAQAVSAITAVLNRVTSAGSATVGKFRNLGTTMTSALAGALAAGRGRIVSVLNATMQQGVNSSRNILVNGMRASAVQATNSFRGAFKTGLASWKNQTVSAIRSGCSQSKAVAVSGMREAGNSGAAAFQSGFKTGMKNAGTAMAAAAKTAASTVKTSAYSNFYSAGKNAGQGLIDGMNAKKQSVINTAAAIGTAAARKLDDALEINSPSRVTRRTGVGIGEGLEYGMMDKMKDVKNAAAMLASSAARSIDRSYDYSGLNAMPRIDSHQPAAAGAGIDYEQLGYSVARAMNDPSTGGNSAAALVKEIKSFGDGVVDAISNMGVSMDGKKVGNMVTRTVDKNIGRSVAVKGGGF